MISPMLAEIGDIGILKSKRHIFEPKLDGYRAIFVKNNEGLEFFSRNGKNISSSYPKFAFSKSIKAKTCTLDGEIVVYDNKGNPSFSLMQDKNKFKNAVYVVFDILEKDGMDLTSLPLIERKRILEKTIVEGKNLQIIFYTSNGKKLWEEMKKRGVEGVIAKKIDSIYTQKRSNSWIKIKFEKTIDAVIIGYLSKKRKLSSLALGLFDGKRLVHIGNVGTGFSEKMLKELKIALMKIENEKIDDIQFVKPKFVVEVKYFEVTPDKKLRSPVFLKLRMDKNVKECKIDQLLN